MVENNKSNILLESGTNEIEVMRFSVSGEFYGINVAKVQEIIMAEKVKPMPHSHPAVEGIFKPREELITVINLVYYLFGESREHGEKDLFIITNFNRMTVAFRVGANGAAPFFHRKSLLDRMQQAVPLGGTKNPVCLHPGMDPGQTSQQMDSWQEEKGGEAPGAAKKVLTLHLLYPPDYIQNYWTEARSA